MKGLMFISREDIQLEVAIKKAALFKMPSGMMAQAKVAISAMCNSVSMPAKLISNRFR